GNMTLTMAHRWPNATITGYDASAEMIEDARTLIANQQGSYKNVSFQQQEAGSWTPPTDTDVIVSNAMFQWLLDHINVINEWLELLKPGAWFAMQVPGNNIARSHQFISELAHEPKYKVQAKQPNTAETTHQAKENTRMLFDQTFRPKVGET